LTEEAICSLKPDANHVILSYTPGRLAAYLNGQAVGSSDAFTGPLSDWVPARLRFGEDAASGKAWRGRVEAVAIYSRWITRSEAELHANLVQKRPAIGPPPARARVRARLVESSSMPTPAGIAPYRRGLLANVYELESVLEGEAPPKRFMAAHWVIMDAKPLTTAKREPRQLFTMLLEDYDTHPELDGERLIMDVEDLTLPLYFDVGS